MTPDQNKPVIEISPDAAIPFSEDTIAIYDEYGEALENMGSTFHHYHQDFPTSFSEWEDSLAGGIPDIGQLSFLSPRSPTNSSAAAYKPPYHITNDKKANTLSLDVVRAKVRKILGSLALSQSNTAAPEIEPEKASTAAEWFTMHMGYGDVTDWDKTPLPAEMRQEVHEILFADLGRRLDVGSIYDVGLVITAMMDLFPEKYSSESDIAQALKNRGDAMKVLLSPGSFPGIRYDQDDVSLLLESGYYRDLLDNWDYMGSSVDRKVVLETLIGRYPPEVLTCYLFAIAETVELPETLVIAAAKQSPFTVLDLLAEGLLAHIDKEKLFETLAKDSRDLALESLGFMRLSIKSGTIDRLVEGGYLSVTDVLMCQDRIDGLGTAEELTAWLSGRIASLQQEIRNCDIYELNMVARKVIFDILFDAQDSNFDDLMCLASNQEDAVRVVLTHQDSLMRLIEGDHYMGFVVQSIKNLAVQYDEVQQLYTTRIEPKLRERQALEEAKRLEAEQQNKRRADQREAELTYFEAGNYRIDTYDSGTDLSSEAIYRAFEGEHCVKQAPTLAEQAKDESRDNLVTYVKVPYGLGTDTNTAQGKRRTCTEHVALAEYSAALTQIAYNQAGELDSPTAESLRDNLTFIGEKEYKEAARAMAAYWKEWLDRDESRQLFVLKGAISSASYVKSDEYLFDRILEYFSDEEMVEYQNRLIVDQEQIIDDSPEHLKVVLLDDWTISGAQLRSAAGKFLCNHPNSGSCLEIGLICASKERIALGLEGISGVNMGGIRQKGISIPVKAYYMAHPAPLMHEASSRGVHITGAHSSVDYGFENILSEIYTSLKAGSLPPLANVVRPYREDGYHRLNAERLMRVYGLAAGSNEREA